MVRVAPAANQHCDRSNRRDRACMYTDKHGRAHHSPVRCIQQKVHAASAAQTVEMPHPRGSDCHTGADTTCVKRGCSHLCSHLLNNSLKACLHHPRDADATVMRKERIYSICNNFGPSLVTSTFPPRAARRPTVTPRGRFWKLRPIISQQYFDNFRNFLMLSCSTH